MSLLPFRSRVRRQCANPPNSPPTTPPTRAQLPARVQLSADLLAAVLEVEGQLRPTLDDLEWADAVAARLEARQEARSAANQCNQTRPDYPICASTATTPRRKPSTARRALPRTGSSATSAT